MNEKNNGVLSQFNSITDVSDTEYSFVKTSEYISRVLCGKMIEMNFDEKQFANFLGVSITMILKWLSGSYNFKLLELIRTFDKLNLTFDIMTDEKPLELNNQFSKKVIREPKVKNKYNVEFSDLNRLEVIDDSKFGEPLFWRNSVIDAWCISKSVGDDDSSFWLGVYDKPQKYNKNVVKVNFFSYGGMCGYIFKNFYDYDYIECEMDLLIQELFLETLNYLIDNNILKIGEKENV